MLMTCGAAAGLAGAFSAPLSGAVFSLEELHRNFSTEILLSTLAASVTSDFISSYIFGLEPVFTLFTTARMPLSYYWLVLLLGAGLGVFGVFYNWFTAKVQDLYGKIPRRSVRILIPFLCIIPLAAFFSAALGSGHHLVEQTALGQFALGTLIVLLIVKFCFSIFSFGAGVPGGIFLPLLVLGAVTGGIFAEAAEQVMDDNGIYLVNFGHGGMLFRHRPLADHRCDPDHGDDRRFQEFPLSFSGCADGLSGSRYSRRTADLRSASAPHAGKRRGAGNSRRREEQKNSHGVRRLHRKPHGWGADRKDASSAGLSGGFCGAGPEGNRAPRQYGSPWRR